MRILHLLASPVWSGPAENVALLALAQRKQGHEVHVAVDRKRPRLKDEEPSVPRLQALELLDEGGLELSVKSFPWAMARDVVRLKLRALDVVHTHFSHDHLLAKFGAPKGAVLIRSVHAPRSLKHLPRADGWTVPSERELTALPRGPHRVLTALLSPEFIPADRAARRAELNLRGDPLVAMVSHFQPSRRIDLGLRAFAELRVTHPGARMVLLGDGPLHEELQTLAKALGISDGVTFAGYQSGERFVHHLQACDAVFILGLGNDWTARTARQARACGARVVAVDEGALSSWADAIVPLDPGAISRAAVSAEKRAVQEIDNEEIARDILALYEEAKG